jgi:hypothetical protein
MSLFLPLKRATLLVPSGPVADPDRKHLFILLTDPGGSGVKQILMVPLLSIKPNVPHDSSCVLLPGDHPFVKRASFVQFARARIEDASKLLRGVKDGKLIPHDPVDSVLFTKICKGLAQSPYTPGKILKFYNDANTIV